MKKLFTFIVILAVATTLAFGQAKKTDGNVDGATGAKLGGFQSEDQKPPTPQGQPGPQGPTGPQGETGATGLSGRDGRTVIVHRTKVIHQYRPNPNGYTVWSSVKSMDPASVGYVNAKNAQLAQWAAASFVAKTSSAPTAGYPALTAAPVAASTATAPGETDMWNPLTVVYIVIALLLAFSIGHWIWGNLVHNRGLHDSNHKETGEFNPDHDKWGEFSDSTTKHRHDRHAVSNETAIGRANAYADAAHARAMEAAARRDTRQAERDVTMANRQIIGPPHGGAGVWMIPAVGAGPNPPAAAAPVNVTVNNYNGGGHQGGGQQGGGGGNQPPQTPRQPRNNPAPNTHPNPPATPPAPAVP